MHCLCTRACSIASVKEAINECHGHALFTAKMPVGVVFMHLVFCTLIAQLTLTLLCLQADGKWSDMPVRGSMDSDASSEYSTSREAVHHSSSLFSTSTDTRPGGLIRSDRQPGGGAHNDSKRVKHRSAEIARDSNDPASSEHKSAETAQDGGQEISSTHRSHSLGDAIAAFVVGRSRSSTLRALREIALGVVKEDKA